LILFNIGHVQFGKDWPKETIIDGSVGLDYMKKDHHGTDILKEQVLLLRSNNLYPVIRVEVAITINTMNSTTYVFWKKLKVGSLVITWKNLVVKPSSIFP